MSEVAEKAGPQGDIADETIAIEHGMTAEEYATVCEILDRTPTVTEVGMYSVMWSEHCSYKSSRVHLKTLPVEGEAVLQGPGENAGAVDLGDGIAGVFKVESHNHPSYIEPYQGAATGVGGILRDIITMGARPLALLDSLRFGELDSGRNRHLLDGVVGGIAGYGNCMGIPTVGGEICFDPSYDKNPLVNAMCFGIAPADRIIKAVADGIGNPVIYVGAKTGRDGIYGVSLLASATFDAEAAEKRPAVQVGDPFTEKVLMEACLEIIEKDLAIGMQDFGGAGLTCATSEMASNSDNGMEIDVALVPRRETGLSPYEVMLSESQERMMLVTTPELIGDVMDIFDKWDLDAVVIGKVTDDGLLRVLDDGVVVAEVPAHSLAEEGPCYNRPYTIADTPATLSGAELPCEASPSEVLQTLLCDPNIASKRWVFQQYDQTVRYNTVQRAGGEAAVIWLKEAGSDAAVAISLDGNPWYTGLDARRGAQLAVAEACRNVACTGARPLGITNCLNFGSPEVEERMGEFVAAVQGLGEASIALGVPVTGGNVSFYNETVETPILPTPVVGAVGKLDHYDASVRSGFAAAGDTVWMVGAFAASDAGLGGSAYVRNFHDSMVGAPPELDLELESRLQNFLIAAAAEGLLASAKDCSDGGFAVALAETCFAAADAARTDSAQASSPPSPLPGMLGANVEIAAGKNGIHATLFGETASRVLVSARGEHAVALAAMATRHDVPIAAIGEVTEAARLRVEVAGETVLEEDAQQLYSTWSGALAHAMENH